MPDTGKPHMCKKLCRILKFLDDKKGNFKRSEFEKICKERREKYVEHRKNKHN